jgi:hypothetical protein
VNYNTLIQIRKKSAVVERIKLIGQFERIDLFLVMDGIFNMECYTVRNLAKLPPFVNIFLHLNRFYVTFRENYLITCWRRLRRRPYRVHVPVVAAAGGTNQAIGPRCHAACMAFGPASCVPRVNAALYRKDN